MLTRIIPNARLFGAGPALLYDLDRLCDRLGLPAHVYRYAFVAQPVADGPLLPPRRGAAIAVTPIDPLDPALTALELSDDVLRFRSAQQPVVFAARQDGELIGCLWLSFAGFSEDEVRCRYRPVPPDQTCWDYGVYLRPDRRSGFGFARLWDEANADLRRRGVRWTLSRISTFNLASLAAHRRLGAVTLGHAVFVAVGRWQLMVSDLAPRPHLSLGPDSVPDLILAAPGTGQPGP